MAQHTSLAFVRPRGASNEGGAGEQQQRPPRHRMRGGDLPLGATPVAPGHAGRARLARFAIFSLLIATAITTSQSFNFGLTTTIAHADQTLRFQNGGTAEQHDDGTITGTVYVSAVWAGVATTYRFTMPDGQVLPAHCIDFGLVDPADDNYAFTAYPVGDGTYHVSAHTNFAAYYQTPTMPRVPANGAAIQRTQLDGTWRPDVIRTGMARVIKTSSLPSLTNGLSTYSLEGATFSVWLDEACTQSANNVVLTTNAEGKTTPANLEEGTYWIREDHAPAGFAIDQTPRPFTVTAGETTSIAYEDAPLFQTPELLLQKTDSASNATQESSSLAGAEFAVSYYDGFYDEGSLPSNPTRRWVFRSNANGGVPFAASAKVSGPDLYLDGNGRPTLPLGTITYQETKAPTGYFLEGQTATSPADFKAPVHLLRIEGATVYVTPVVPNAARRAGIALQKHDDKTAGTPQGDASLAGIEFEIVNANDAAIVVDGVSYNPGEAIGRRLVTDALGRAHTARDYLPLGTYEVREASTNDSMRLTTQPQRITLNAGQTNSCVELDSPFGDAVVRGGVRIHKLDDCLQRGQAQGDGTLAGATFTVSLESTNPVVVNDKTYAKGQIVTTLTTDEQGVAQSGAEELPYGTYAIREQNAPEGYLPNREYAITFEVREQGEIVDLSTAPCEEPIIRGGVRLGKLDHDLMAQRAQGDATLAGATFSVYLESEGPVFANGGIIEPGSVVATMTTDEQGIASTDEHALPYGTYCVRETTAPNGYLLNEGFERRFSIRENGKIVNLGTGACADDVIRGGIAVGKVSRETSQHVGQGEASLKGAVFSVTLASEQAVIVDGTLRDPGSLVCTLTTGENGYAATDARLLPFGTYEIREVEPPAGFLPNEDWSLTVEIREDGVIVDKSSESESADDQVMRGGFSLNKVDEDSMERMGGTGFRITSLTTGETHVAVTDENGLFSTERQPHTQNTNANDSAVDENDVVIADKVVPDAGLWFSGRADLQTGPNNEMGALPYDSYEVRELRCERNEGKELVTFTVYIHEDNYFADLGTIDNKTPSSATPHIATTLTYDDTSHVAPATQDVTLVDVVQYEGLTPGEQYELLGILVNKDACNPDNPEDGAVASANTTFTPATAAGKTELAFHFDASACEGVTTVAFEYLNKDGSEVARHNDLEDIAQTVRFPSIGTTCTDGNGNHEISAAQERVELVDTVAYRNLEPHKHYEVVGTLYNKDTGAKLTDANGREITSCISFAPDEPDGTIDVSFSLTTETVRGTTLVAFEHIRRNGITLALHENMDDGEQTVTIPSVETEFTDAAGHHTASEPEGDDTQSSTITLVDTVTYSNLIEGKTYTLHGIVMDKTTGEPLRAPDGSAIESSTDFVPNSSVGATTLGFVVDRSLVAGKQVVAFETLLFEGREIAIHANIEDASQTVSVPSIGTTLGNAAGAHEVLATERVDLIDTVAYSGLTPGESYRMLGTIVDAATGEPIRNADDNLVTGEQAFEAAGTDGSVAVTLSVDAAALAGKTVVAFEQLVQDSSADDVSESTTRTLARHEDLHDEGQTVSFPRIGTNACDADDNDSYVLGMGTVRVRDEVAYTNLRPGIEYVMSGTLYNKATGSALIDSNGEAVSSQVTFTPESPDGTVTMEFKFDASLVAGTDVVAFESCQRDGVEVAVHADLADEAQTVHVARIGTEAHDKKSGSHEAVATKEVTIVDVVSYEGLVPGTEYKLQGTLMNKQTSKPLQNTNNEPVTTTITLTPEKSSGSVEVTFTIDATQLANNSAVVFERLFVGQKLVALHEDIHDTKQSVSFRTPTEEEKKKDGDKNTSNSKSNDKATTGTGNSTGTGTHTTSSSKGSTPRTGDDLASPLAFAALGSFVLLLARKRVRFTRKHAHL